jgi:phosphatidylserine decarboxylase
VVFDDWVVGALGWFPTRALSRLWGAANEIYLPVALRKPLLGAYASAFNCNLEEVRACVRVQV